MIDEARLKELRANYDRIRELYDSEPPSRTVQVDIALGDLADIIAAAEQVKRLREAADRLLYCCELYWDMMPNDVRYLADALKSITQPSDTFRLARNPATPEPSE